MKRTRSVAADYDPVYPYDQNEPSIQPPYVNTQRGLDLNPPGSLAVNIDPPFTFGPSGAIKLATGTGLTLNKGVLTARIGAGLTTNDEGAIILADANRSLTFTDPLSKNNDEVTLKIGHGLSLDQGNLKVDFPTPLLFTLPLVLTGNTVTLQLGTGLEVTPQGQLTVPGTTFAAPLKKTDQEVTLSIGAGLTVQNNQLQAVPPPVTNYASPLVHSNNLVTLNVGAGLELRDNALMNTNPTPLFFTAPLVLNTNTVSIQATNGLQVQDGKLKLKVGSGLQVTQNAVTAKVGPGLELNAQQAIVPKLAPGLSVNSNGQIQINQPSYPTSLTLWTGPDPSPNGYINGTPLVRCFISLTRIDSVVTLTAKFTGVGNYISVGPTQLPFNLTMEFDQFGNLKETGSINSKSTWGQKPINDNTVQVTPHQTWRMCMPNILAYPAKTGCVFNGPLGINSGQLTNEEIDFMVQLNHTISPGAAFSISFRFYNFNKMTSTQPFKTDCISVSYIGANPT